MTKIKVKPNLAKSLLGIRQIELITGERVEWINDENKTCFASNGGSGRTYDFEDVEFLAVIPDQSYPKRVKIDLSGERGNALFLAELLRSTLTKIIGLQKSDIEIQEILQDMLSSDYDHVIKIFNLHLGEYYELINRK